VKGEKTLAPLSFLIFVMMLTESTGKEVALEQTISAGRWTVLHRTRCHVVKK
jgi:hypothetical protein